MQIITILDKENEDPVYDESEDSHKAHPHPDDDIMITSKTQTQSIENQTKTV